VRVFGSGPLKFDSLIAGTALIDSVRLPHIDDQRTRCIQRFEPAG
jgi:hypothetical protein